MSAFGGKADMPIAECLLLRSLLGVKRTCLFAAQMSAYDPKRTSVLEGQQRHTAKARSILYTSKRRINSVAMFPLGQLQPREVGWTFASVPQTIRKRKCDGTQRHNTGLQREDMSYVKESSRAP